jgi:4'-phosphopantetheinyl transferase
MLIEVPKGYSLGPTDVHVWVSRLGWSHQHLQGLYEILSLDERRKAERFHFQVDRERHVIGRALARIVLAHLLDVAPNNVRFRYNKFGKPYLDCNDNGPQRRFNLSHSGDLILLAVAAGREIGVDVEGVRQDVKVDRIAARYFSARERAELASLPPEKRAAAFFACWSRKEAFIKAKGIGLSFPLDCFDVSLKPDAPAVLLETRPDPLEAGRWTIRDLDVGPSYKAAIAVEGCGFDLKIIDCCSQPSFLGTSIRVG